MVNKINIGVIGIQGAVSEHVSSMQKTLQNSNINGNVKIINNIEEINEIDGLIFPGGETTTISKILNKSRFFETISKRIQKNNLPIMGTCAGCVLLSSKMTENPKKIRLFSAMDMQVKRNAFGRQRESFEKNVKIKGFSKPYNAVFIRAPVIEKVWGNCEILSTIEKKIVMAKQDNLLAVSFHPELTVDLRIHKYFLDMF
jgi:pyridoxal 5'-phosphate synthase pdxT subunit